MEIKLNSNDSLPLKLFKFDNLTIVVRPVFEKDCKYYPEILLEECLKMSFKNDTI